MWTMLFLLLMTASDSVVAKADRWIHPTPRALNNKHPLEERSPKPTPAPRIRGRVGAISYNQLFARDTTYTCGYFDGDPSQPYTCDDGTECAVNGDYWQCCTMIADSGSTTIDQASCTDYSTCVNYISTSAYPNSGSIAYGTASTIYCPEASPTCYTVALIAGIGSTYVSYGCWTELTTLTVYATPTGNSTSSSGSPSSTAASSTTSISSSSQASSPSSSELLTPTPARSSSVPPTLISSSTQGTNIGQPSFSIPHATPQTSTTASGSSTSAINATHTSVSTNVGAIAGGVVGGVAGIGLIGVAIGYLMYRKRQQRVEPMREISPGFYTPSQNY